MRILNLKIENFKGVKNADLTFDGHTLLVGLNNVLKLYYLRGHAISIFVAAQAILPS